MKNRIGKISTTVWMLLLGVLFVIAGYIYISCVGDEYVYRALCMDGDILEIIEPDPANEDECIELVEMRKEGDNAVFRLRSRKPGKGFLTFDVVDGVGSSIAVFFVHRNGVITWDDYFGDCTGMPVIHIGFSIYIALLLAVLIVKLRRSLRKCLYQYRNILYFGVIVFLANLLLVELLSVSSNGGVIEMLRRLVGTAKWFIMATFPVIILVTIMVTVSNIQLIRKEGRTWRNMLACLLGIFVGAFSLLPNVVENYLDKAQWIDTHRYTGIGRFVSDFLVNTSTALAFYLECILLGTIIVSTMAARRVPKLNKDYIIIHGSQIRKDGSLTKLLQMRADRAIEFAGMQKTANDKDIIFVPSGGKGSDEVISEGEAIRNYLVSQDIPEDRILVEDQSVNTEENILNAVQLIRERDPEAKIAFSTTNYHVFRTGLIATSKGVEIEGIGSRTKRYFWINAFVREFIATIYAERRRHAFVLGMIALLGAVITVMTYISNVVLS